MEGTGVEWIQAALKEEKKNTAEAKTRVFLAFTCPNPWVNRGGGCLTHFNPEIREVQRKVAPSAGFGGMSLELRASSDPSRVSSLFLARSPPWRRDSSPRIM